MKTENNPNIIHFIDIYWQDKKDLGFVFEYSDLGDLYTWVTNIEETNCNHQELCLGEEFSAHILFQILNALAFLHDHAIVHRDVKLENILLFSSKYSPIAKLCDFGLSVQFNYNSANNKNRVISGMCGTPYYVAPEMLLETYYGTPIDMWATGVILFIMLTGCPPFYSFNDDQTEIFEKIVEGTLDFPKTSQLEISFKARLFVHCFLCGDPDLRISAKEVGFLRGF